MQPLLELPIPHLPSLTLHPSTSTPVDAVPPLTKNPLIMQAPSTPIARKRKADKENPNISKRPKPSMTGRLTPPPSSDGPNIDNASSPTNTTLEIARILGSVRNPSMGNKRPGQGQSRPVLLSTLGRTITPPHQNAFGRSSSPAPAMPATSSSPLPSHRFRSLPQSEIGDVEVSHKPVASLETISVPFDGSCILVLGRSHHTSSSHTLPSNSSSSSLPSTTLLKTSLPPHILSLTPETHNLPPSLQHTKPRLAPLPRAAKHASRYHVVIHPTTSSEGELKVHVLGQNGCKIRVLGQRRSAEDLDVEGLGEGLGMRYASGRVVTIKAPEEEDEEDVDEEAGERIVDIEVDMYSCKAIIHWQLPSPSPSSRSASQIVTLPSRLKAKSSGEITPEATTFQLSSKTIKAGTDSPLTPLHGEEDAAIGDIPMSPPETSSPDEAEIPPVQPISDINMDMADEHQQEDGNRLSSLPPSSPPMDFGFGFGSGSYLNYDLGAAGEGEEDDGVQGGVGASGSSLSRLQDVPELDLPVIEEVERCEEVVPGQVLTVELPDRVEDSFVPPAVAPAPAPLSVPVLTVSEPVIAVIASAVGVPKKQKKVIVQDFGFPLPLLGESSSKAAKAEGSSKKFVTTASTSTKADAGPAVKKMKLVVKDKSTSTSTAGNASVTSTPVKRKHKDTMGAEPSKKIRMDGTGESSKKIRKEGDGESSKKAHREKDAAGAAEESSKKHKAVGGGLEKKGKEVLSDPSKKHKSIAHGSGKEKSIGEKSKVPREGPTSDAVKQKKKVPRPEGAEAAKKIVATGDKEGKKVLKLKISKEGNAIPTANGLTTAITSTSAPTAAASVAPIPAPIVTPAAAPIIAPLQPIPSPTKSIYSQMDSDGEEEVLPAEATTAVLLGIKTHAKKASLDGKSGAGSVAPGSDGKKSDVAEQAGPLAAVSDDVKPNVAPGPVNHEIPPPPASLDLRALLATSLVFSGVSAISAVDLVKAILDTQPSLRDLGRDAAWSKWVGDVLDSHAMFGRVDRKGKDSSGHPLHPLYYYVPASDPDQERASELGSLMRPLRGVQRGGGKAIDWRPVGSRGRRS